MNKNVKSTLILTLTAVIWGSAFVAQREGMSSIGPFLFSAIRMYLGSLTLLPIILYFDAKSRRQPVAKAAPSAAGAASSARPASSGTPADLRRGGLLCGLIIFFAANFQQVGLVSVSAGKAAFLTTLYILLVPLIGLLMKQRVTWNAWLGVLLGTAGLYFLCITEAFTVAPGDLIVLIGALFWALHILCLDHYAPRVMASKLVAVQFLVAGTLSLLVALLTEELALAGISEALPAIAYAGILSSGLAFLFQALGQRDANPTTASIIMSTEALFGAIAGYLFLQEVFTQREFIGCILMFTAVIIAQLPLGELLAARRKAT